VFFVGTFLIYKCGFDLSFHTKDELKAELEQLQEDVLNERLAEADHAPVHLPPGSRVEDSKHFLYTFFKKYLSFSIRSIRTESRTPAAAVAQEDDEDAQLKELQAALAM
jgi:charged multivesicular body protein 4